MSDAFSESHVCMLAPQKIQLRVGVRVGLFRSEYASVLPLSHAAGHGAKWALPLFLASGFRAPGSARWLTAGLGVHRQRLPVSVAHWQSLSLRLPVADSLTVTAVTRTDSDAGRTRHATSCSSSSRHTLHKGRGARRLAESLSRTQ